jgi:Plasmid encoded RepA protein
VVLGELFYKAITGAAVPVDMRVLRAIKRSVLALDLYAWVTWRGFKLRRSAFIPWEGLASKWARSIKTLMNLHGRPEPRCAKFAPVTLP